ALILNRSVDALVKKFTISQLVDRKREKLFELIPREEGSFEKIQLFFADEKMQELKLVDVFGSETTIILSDSKLNPHLEAGIFKFTAPAGTDIMIDAADN
ncbi:MAG: outer-membrane lipoprotein carrier protein LolA, partial [Pseudomonadales bacterium]|nr:outer-membrane lipoprotein carrier protein LolA [Pseudomonadales bacterium]